MGKGLLLVVSGPSGVGKGTVCKALQNRNPSVHFSVSATTRVRRNDEIEGVNYFFKTRDEFERMITHGEFLEYTLLFNTNYYGTPRAYIEDEVSSGHDVLLEIDYHGASKIKEAYPQAVLVFVAPPMWGDLQNRIVNNYNSSLDSLSMRFAAAKDEISNAYRFDYVVTNDVVEKAVTSIEAIVNAEKCKVSNNIEYIEQLYCGK